MTTEPSAIDKDALWRDMVQKHTKGGACNFRDAAFEFAEKAVSLEREACAKLCASLVTNDWDRSGSEEGSFNIGCEECAAAIRARSEHTKA